MGTPYHRSAYLHPDYMQMTQEKPVLSQEAKNKRVKIDLGYKPGKEGKEDFWKKNSEDVWEK